MTYTVPHCEVKAMALYTHNSQHDSMNKTKISSHKARTSANATSFFLTVHQMAAPYLALPNLAMVKNPLILS